MSESNLKLNIITFLSLLCVGSLAEAKYEEKQMTRPDGSIYCRIYDDNRGSYYYNVEGPCKRSPLPTNGNREVIVCRLSPEHFVTIESLREGDALLRLYQGATLLGRDIVSSTLSKNGVIYRSSYDSKYRMWIDMKIGGEGIQFGSKIGSGHCL